MKRIDKCRLAIEKGFKYNPITGDVIGVKGNPIKKKCNGYIALTLWKDGKRIYLFAHQFAWYVLYEECVDLIDHKNRIKTDNRKCNLREYSKQLNALNVDASGAYLDKRHGTWESKIAIDGKGIYLGKYKTKEEASKAYKEYKYKLIA